MGGIEHEYFGHSGKHCTQDESLLLNKFREGVDALTNIEPGVKYIAVLDPDFSTENLEVMRGVQSYMSGSDLTDREIGLKTTFSRDNLKEYELWSISSLGVNNINAAISINGHKVAHTNGFACVVSHRGPGITKVFTHFEPMLIEYDEQHDSNAAITSSQSINWNKPWWPTILVTCCTLFLCVLCGAYLSWLLGWIPYV